MYMYVCISEIVKYYVCYHYGGKRSMQGSHISCKVKVGGAGSVYIQLSGLYRPPSTTLARLISVLPFSIRDDHYHVYSISS